jgi:hypothetical protein
MVTRDEFANANRRGKSIQNRLPKAVSARYDHRIGRVIIHLNSNLEIAFSPHDVEGLESAKPRQLSKIEISPSGFGIYFPELDVDLLLPALMEGLLGSKQWMASRLGAEGGKSKSEAKSEAARANGKLGGRPRKLVAS